MRRFVDLLGGRAMKRRLRPFGEKRGASDFWRFALAASVLLASNAVGSAGEWKADFEGPAPLEGWTSGNADGFNPVAWGIESAPFGQGGGDAAAALREPGTEFDAYLDTPPFRFETFGALTVSFQFLLEFVNLEGALADGFEVHLLQATTDNFVDTLYSLYNPAEDRFVFDAESAIEREVNASLISDRLDYKVRFRLQDQDGEPSIGLFALDEIVISGVALDCLLADANCDGLVDLADFNRLKAHFNQAVDGAEQGDFTGDGFVDLEDFNLLKANFGTRAAVPEPSSWTIASALFLLAGAGWRRGGRLFCRQPAS